MSILDQYKKQFEEDKKNENDLMPEGVNEEDFSHEEVERYKKELKKLRDAENDMAKTKAAFDETYIKISEDSLNKTGKTKIENVNITLKRAYCPHCGKEIVSEFPVMWNPFTHEKICRYDCECGFKANLEYTYPRLIITDDNGEEISIQF
jgi:RNase P subunit RPR2